MVCLPVLTVMLKILWISQEVPSVYQSFVSLRLQLNAVELLLDYYWLAASFPNLST